MSGLGPERSSAGTHPAGTREILEYWFENRSIREEYLIVHAGQLAGGWLGLASPAQNGRHPRPPPE